MVPLAHPKIGSLSCPKRAKILKISTKVTEHNPGIKKSRGKSGYHYIKGQKAKFSIMGYYAKISILQILYELQTTTIYYIPLLGLPQKWTQHCL